MVEVRQFGQETARPFPFPGPEGLFSRIIQLPTAVKEQLSDEEIEERFGGKPILLDRDVAVAALYLEPHGEIHEHESDQPTVILVIGGSGFMQVGGPEAETQAVKAGDAVLWPKCSTLVRSVKSCLEPGWKPSFPGKMYRQLCVRKLERR